MGLYRTVSETNSDFSRKSQIFPPHHVYLTPPLNGVPLQLGIGAWSQKTRMLGYRAENKKFNDTFGHLDIIHEHGGRTDGHLATAKTAVTHSVAW